MNLSRSFKLNENQVEVLSLGLGYIDRPIERDKADIQEGVDRLARALKLKMMMTNNFNKGKKQDSLMKIPSNFTPPKGLYPPEIDHFQRTLSQVGRELEKNNQDQPNFSKNNRIATKDLATRAEIIIKPADKGSCIVIMDREDYIREAERQLSSTKHYREIEEPIFPDTAHKYNELVAQMKKKKLISAKVAKYIHSDRQARERVFYMLPKVHKDRSKWLDNRIPPGRPIVSDVNSESYNIAYFIDACLAEYADKHPTYVKNTYDFLDRISNHKLTPDIILISLDVESLYTNINKELGIRAVREAFGADRKELHEYVIKLLDLSLSTNDFCFNEKHYLQVSGTAMGKRYAPHFADITMAYIESRLREIAEYNPVINFRYLDDIFLVWERSEEEFIEYFVNINSINESISFTYELDRTSLTFLDVLVYKGERFLRDGILDTKVNFKATDSHALLHRNSYHPPHTFQGLIKSQFVRYDRICNNDSDYWEAAEILMQALVDRGYEKKEMQRLAQQIRRESERNENFLNTVPCGSRNCKLCKLIDVRSKVTLTNKIVAPKSLGTCDSRNVIYLIYCLHCPNAYYVGQTVSYRTRLTNHMSDIKLKRDKPVANHFNSAGKHSLKTLVLEEVRQDRNSEITNSRLDKKEKSWIKSLNAIGQGLNLAEAYNIQSDIPFILKHSDISSELTDKANELMTAILGPATMTKKGTKIPWRAMQANRANKSLAQKLIRAKLPVIEEV